MQQPTQAQIDEMPSSRLRDLLIGLFKATTRIGTVWDFIKQWVLTFVALKIFNFAKAFLFALYALIPLATRQAIAKGVMTLVGMLPAAISGIIPAFLVRMVSFFVNLAPVIIAVGLIRHFIIKPWFDGKDEVAGAAVATTATVFTEPSLLTNNLGLSFIAAIGSSLAAAGRYFFGGAYEAALNIVSQELGIYCHEHQDENPAIGAAIAPVLANTENITPTKMYYLLLSKNSVGGYKASLYPRSPETDKLYDPDKRSIANGSAPIIDNGNTVIAWTCATIAALRLQWLGLAAVVNIPQPTVHVQHSLSLPGYQAHQGAQQGFPGGAQGGATVEVIHDAPAVVVAAPAW